MRKCIFCDHKADSKEHIWSKWILKLLPDAKDGTFTRLLRDGTEKTIHLSKPVQTAGVVCERACNNGWMSSKLEEPMRAAVSDIILKNTVKTFSPSDCKTIAAWAFKSMLLANHMTPKETHYFTEAQRRKFAIDQSIPSGINVWIAQRNAGFVTGRFTSTFRCQNPSGPLTPHLVKPPTLPRYRVEIYDCIFSIGYLLLQITSTRWAEREVANLLDAPTITQDEVFNFYASPVWPNDGRTCVKWPPSASVGNDMFDRFCNRFNQFMLPPWMTT